jgi:hypothetical protein
MVLDLVFGLHVRRSEKNGKKWGGVVVAVALWEGG